MQMVETGLLDSGQRTNGNAGPTIGSSLGFINQSGLPPIGLECKKQSAQFIPEMTMKFFAKLFKYSPPKGPVLDYTEQACDLQVNMQAISRDGNSW